MIKEFLLVLIILYVVTLVYISITDRFKSYATMIAVQGLILMGIALLRLHTINWWELGFVLAETLIFKAILVPRVLFNIIKKTGMTRISATGTSQFNSLLLSIIALVVSAAVTYYIADATMDIVFFGVALYALTCGLILITLRTRIFSHLVGFLVIENGVLLFSMAVGVEMPFLINIAILIDIIISVLMLGMFLSKIGDTLQDMDSGSLTSLKD